MGTAFKILPKNYLADWGEFESWQGGTAPDGWVCASTLLCSSDATNYKFGSNGARLIGSGATGLIYRTIPNGSDYAGRTFRLSVWGKSSSSSPYIQIDDGVTNKTSPLVTYNAWTEVTTQPFKISASATQLRINLVATVGQTAYFDSAVLVEGEDVFTTLNGNIDVSSYSPSLSLNQDQYQITQREGSYIPETHLGSKSIDISGMVVGSDVASCRTHFDSLIKSLLSWKPEDKRHLYLYDDRVADVFLSNFNWNYMNGLKDIQYTASVSLPDATTRYIGKLRKQTVIAASVTEFALPYNGSAKSLPIVSFIANQGAAITTCVLENLTTGENFSYSGTVPTNVAMDIDCDEGTVYNSSINAISLWSGDFLGLVRGTNNFRFSGTNCTINIDYYERYL